MSDVFVVRNQLGHYWGKKKRWVDGTKPRSVLRSAHEDEAINTLFELSSKDMELRGEVLTVSLDDSGDPVIEPSDILLPEESEEELAAAQQSTDSEPQAEQETPQTA